jgi:hypothetical protein
VALDWQEILLGVALPVAGGVLTYLAVAGMGVIGKRRKESAEYKRLHQVVFALIEDALGAAKQIAEGKAGADAWAITNGYWIQVQTRYAELCRSPNEAHEISKFFEYTSGLGTLARSLAHRSWQMELTATTGNELPVGLESEGPAMIRELRGRMEAQASKLKSTYWPPGYKSPIFPYNPNEPKKFD